jgi:hypothetical protein
MATPLDAPVYLKERESLRLPDGVGLEVRCLLGNLQVAKFLIAGEPAEYRGSSRHRGIGTDGLRRSELMRAAVDGLEGRRKSSGTSSVTRRISSESGFDNSMAAPDAFDCLPVPLDAIAWIHRGCNVPVHKLDA